MADYSEWSKALLYPEDEHGKRRTALLQAAFEVIANVGFEGLRTRAVALRAGVNIATLHYYFASKQELIEGLAQFLGAKFVELHGPPPEPSGFPALDRLRQEFSDGRYYMQHQPEMLLVMQEFTLRGKRDPEVQQVVDWMDSHWRRGLEEMMQAGVADGTFRADQSVEEMLSLLMAVLTGASSSRRDQIDLLERNIEAWLLSEKTKKQLRDRVKVSEGVER